MMGPKDERCSLILLCVLVCLSHATCVEGQTTGSNQQSSDPSTASVVGFSVVLSFLIIALCIVILLCACYGKCKLPCKPMPIRIQHQENGAEQIPQRVSSTKRWMIEQPTTKTVRPSSLNNQTDVQPERHQRNTSLPPSNSVSSAMLVLGSPKPPRPQLKANHDQPLVDAVQKIPTSSSNQKVVHLSQLNAESFKQLTTNSTGQAKALPLQQQPHRRSSASLKKSSRPSQQRQGSDVIGEKSPGHKSSLQVWPTEIPETGFPYQPGKSSREHPLSYTPDNFQEPTIANPLNTMETSNTPIPYLSNATVQVESPILDTGEDECSSATRSNEIPVHHNTYPRPLDKSSNNSVKSVKMTATPPPAYSTVV